MSSSGKNSSSESPPSKSDSDSSPPPPKSDKDSPSPPPPKGSSKSPSPPSKNSSKSYPPPPKSKNSPSTHSPPHRSSPPKHGSPSHAISPPSEKRNNRNSHHNEDLHITSKELGAIIGVTAAAVVVLIIIILVCVSFCKKKKRRHIAMTYFTDQGPNGEYGSGSQKLNWQNEGQMNHVIKLNPSYSSSGPPSGGWLQPPPPPPPPMMSSGEVSSNYSGPHLPVRPPPAPTYAYGFNHQYTFTYEELVTATNGFSQANLLGQGGFGFVYKGVLPNGKLVAVKSLKSGSGQGEREFQAEVEIISRVHHRHLVSLVGYCIGSGQRMLIYEFVPNNTLEYHLHGNDRPLMEWSKRITIALGAAKGLAYLHEDCHPRIIHRDIKASNILIDNNWEAMVADFGLAKLTDTNDTHVSTRVMGTFGYLAPEYASSGKLTEKSDVFSYGVMLLELITGRPPVDSTGQFMDESLADWARPILTRGLGDGNYQELIDPGLGDNYNPHEMARMAACASASIRHSAKRRPKMSQIVRALEGDVSLDDLNNTVRPGQSSPSGSSIQSSEYDTQSSHEHV